MKYEYAYLRDYDKNFKRKHPGHHRFKIEWRLLRSKNVRLLKLESHIMYGEVEYHIDTDWVERTYDIEILSWKLTGNSNRAANAFIPIDHTKGNII